VLFDHPRLLVLGAPLRDVFVMKLYRAEANDVADMRVIWPHIAPDFRTGAEVAARFFDAFPHAPDDEFLASFIANDIAATTDHPLPERSALK